MSIKQQLQEAIVGALPDIESQDIVLQQAPSHTGADIALKSALVLSKKRNLNLEDIANELVGRLQKNEKVMEFIDRIEIAKGGFINLTVSSKKLFEELKNILTEKNHYGTQSLEKEKTIVIEYSSPNIAKRFNIGHLRSTVIGQALYNLYGFLGYKVVGENHLGDWGTQFGMLLAQITRKNLDASKLTVEDLERFYVEFNEEMAAHQELREQAKLWFKKLEEGDSQARAIWAIVREKSLKEFEKIYDLLDVHIDNAHGESFYENKMPAVIAKIRQKGLSHRSEGAEIISFDFDKESLPSAVLVHLGEERLVMINAISTPAIVMKRDETTTYFTRDIAALRFRLDTWNPSELIYEVGSDQILHFKQVFATAQLLGWGENKRFTHVAHGLIRFQEGKMSTRQGKTIKLEEVLGEAIKRARDIIELSETGRGLDDREKVDVAKAVGIGAIKYFDLSHHPSSDIIFDWEKLFMLEGNSAPYVQYTNARIQSLLTKATQKGGAIEEVALDEAEAKLARVLIHFPDVVQTSALQYSPNLLVNFLFELSQAYNAFYAANRVLNVEREALRVKLSKAVAQVLQNGLQLLGIKAPERM